MALIDIKFNNDDLNLISNDKILGVFVDQSPQSDMVRTHKTFNKKIASSTCGFYPKYIKRFLSPSHTEELVQSYGQTI